MCVRVVGVAVVADVRVVCVVVGVVVRDDGAAVDRCVTRTVCGVDGGVCLHAAVAVVCCVYVAGVVVVCALMWFGGDAATVVGCDGVGVYTVVCGYAVTISDVCVYEVDVVGRVTAVGVAVCCYRWWCVCC